MAEEKTCAVPSCDKARVEGTNFCDEHGATTKKKTQQDAIGQKTGVGCLALLGLAVFFGLVTCGGGSDDPSDSDGNELANCRQAVRVQVKNPDTIDWKTLSTDIQETRISGELTAENDFGGTKTLYFVCDMSGSQVTNATVSE